MGGIALLTKQMALDYAARGIRVNAICCGEIDTPLFVRESYQIGMTPDAYRALLDEAHPIGRIGLPSEAAAAVASLASDDASFVTGVLLPVDGGTRPSRRRDARTGRQGSSRHRRVLGPR